MKSEYEWDFERLNNGLPSFNIGDKLLCADIMVSTLCEITRFQPYNVLKAKHGTPFVRNDFDELVNIPRQCAIPLIRIN